MAGNAIWPAQGQDVKTAITFLRRTATAYDVDTGWIATWGCSCDGHLSAIAAVTPRVPALTSRDAGADGVDDRVQGAVAWYGGFDMASSDAQCRTAPGCFSRDDPRAPEWALLGGMPDELNPGFVRSAGPVNFVTASMPPMLILAWDRDVLIPAAQSQKMADAMRTAGARVELEIMPGIGHDFAGDTTEEIRAANQCALDLTLDFLDLTLRVC